MAADDYAAVPGKFKAMQWDGTNTTAFQAWVQSLLSVHTFGPADWQLTTNTDGTVPRLVLYSVTDSGYFNVNVDRGNYAVFGPYWGSDTTSYWQSGQASWNQLPVGLLNQQYAPAG